MAATAATTEPPLSQLVGDIATDVETLVRQELALTTQNVRDELSGVAHRTTRIAGALVALLVAAVHLTLGAVFALTQLAAWPAWAAFAGVGTTTVLVAVLAMPRRGARGETRHA